MKPLLLLAATVAVSSAAPDGAQLFTTNCSACHLLEQIVVGPSLAEIRDIYQGKPDDFVKWAVAPQKKRPNVIEMPSMVHVGEEGLRAIYEHVMTVSKGAKVQKQKSGDLYAASPPHAARPQVQRIFMPNAGPAAIAVALDANNSLCWDAGSSRLRYAWTGGFIDGFPYWKGNGSSVAKISGKVRYTEAESPLPLDGEVKFHGYTMKSGLPLFRYSIGTTELTESFGALEEGEGFTRSFTLSPVPEKPLVLKFPSDQKVAYNSDKGTWSANILTLASADASEFTLTFSLK